MIMLGTSDVSLENTTDCSRLDPVAEVDNIANALRDQVGTVLRRCGLIVAMSGGIDNSLCAALAVLAGSVPSIAESLEHVG